VNLTTGALQRLTSLGGSEPNWSTGQKILFARNGQIFYINNDGSHRVQLTYRGGDRAKWSPHGAKVTFQRTIRGNTDVYTINANGTGLRRLTRAPTFDGAPAWSPDGTKIVFARGGTDDSTSIYVINANGTGLRRVTTNQTPNGPIGTSPDWQPLP
jgi:Tol biopolymer transport system component